MLGRSEPRVKDRISAGIPSRERRLIEPTACRTPYCVSRPWAMDGKDSARTLPLITGTLQKVCQFARMSFRFCQNAQKDFPRNQIFVAEFTNQGSVGLDLPAFEQQVFNDHFSEGRALFGMDADCRGLSR